MARNTQQGLPDRLRGHDGEVAAGQGPRLPLRLEEGLPRLCPRQVVRHPRGLPLPRDLAGVGEKPQGVKKGSESSPSRKSGVLFGLGQEACPGSHHSSLTTFLSRMPMNFGLPEKWNENISSTSSCLILGIVPLRVSCIVLWRISSRTGSVGNEKPTNAQRFPVEDH